MLQLTVNDTGVGKGLGSAVNFVQNGSLGVCVWVPCGALLFPSLGK